MAMNAIRLTKSFDFEMAHALDGHDGKCKNIHGHSYKLKVTIKGIPLNDVKSPKNGMLIDFTELKELVNRNICDVFDHALVLKDDSKILSLVKDQPHLKIIRVPYPPTCEYLLIDFVARIRDQFPPGVELHALRLEETASSYGEWFAEDNQEF